MAIIYGKSLTNVHILGFGQVGGEIAKFEQFRDKASQVEVVWTCAEER